jgi:hypothetical protein
LVWTFSLALGVGHPVQAGSDVRCAEARSREYDRPAGVVAVFQVILYIVEPAMPDRRFNLFSKNNWRAALLNETEPIWPEVPRVGLAESFSCC